MIRSASTDDAASLAALMIQVWLHTYAIAGVSNIASEYVLSEFTREKLARAINSPDLLYLVMEEADHLVGVAVVDWKGLCPVTGLALPELQKLYVQEHSTGRGLGGRLLERALEECRRRGFSKLGLTVLTTNARAIGFYQKQGFVHVGVSSWVLGEVPYENLVLHKEIV